MVEVRQCDPGAKKQPGQACIQPVVCLFPGPERQHGDAPDSCGQKHREYQRSGVAGTQDGHQRDRPDQIEMFFDCQRPGMRQRAEVPGERNDDVAEIKRGHDHRKGGGKSKSRDDDDHEVERRRKPQQPVPVEAAKADPACGAPFVGQNGSDQIGAEHEEQVDTEEAAAYPRHAAMKRQHCGNGYSANAVKCRIV